MLNALQWVLLFPPYSLSPLRLPPGLLAVNTCHWAIIAKEMECDVSYRQARNEWQLFWHAWWLEKRSAENKGEEEGNVLGEAAVRSRQLTACRTGTGIHSAYTQCDKIHRTQQCKPNWIFHAVSSKKFMAKIFCCAFWRWNVTSLGECSKTWSKFQLSYDCLCITLCLFVCDCVGECVGECVYCLCCLWSAVWHLKHVACGKLSGSVA